MQQSRFNGVSNASSQGFFSSFKGLTDALVQIHNTAAALAQQVFTPVTINVIKESLKGSPIGKTLDTVSEYGVKVHKNVVEITDSFSKGNLINSVVVTTTNLGKIATDTAQVIKDVKDHLKPIIDVLPPKQQTSSLIDVFEQAEAKVSIPADTTLLNAPLLEIENPVSELLSTSHQAANDQSVARILDNVLEPTTNVTEQRTVKNNVETKVDTDSNIDNHFIHSATLNTEVTLWNSEYLAA